MPEPGPEIGVVGYSASAGAGLGLGLGADLATGLTVRGAVGARLGFALGAVRETTMGGKA